MARNHDEIAALLDKTVTVVRECTPALRERIRLALQIIAHENRIAIEAGKDGQDAAVAAWKKLYAVNPEAAADTSTLCIMISGSLLMAVEDAEKL